MRACGVGVRGACFESLFVGIKLFWLIVFRI